MTRRAELAGAFMLLTRLPVGRFTAAQTPPSACVWAYPLVGATVGAGGGAAFWLSHAATLPPGISATLAIAATILITGGLHEDGLADTADGFGGGNTRERKLDIMRDSRIGSFGAIALLLTLALRIGTVAALAEPRAVFIALVAAGALSRGSMAAMLLVLSPARPGGLAAPLAATPPPLVWAALALATLCALPAWPAIPAAIAATLVMIRLARRHIGGYTGDVLGATMQATECTALLALVMG